MKGLSPEASVIFHHINTQENRFIPIASVLGAHISIQQPEKNRQSDEDNRKLLQERDVSSALGELFQRKYIEYTGASEEFVYVRRSQLI